MYCEYVNVYCEYVNVYCILYLPNVRYYKSIHTHFKGYLHLFELPLSSLRPLLALIVQAAPSAA